MKHGPHRAELLDVLADLMNGGRHSRRTLAKMGVSLPTADRWLKSLLKVPGVRSTREGMITWFEWRAPATKPPSIADALASLEAVTRAARRHGFSVGGR